MKPQTNRGHIHERNPAHLHTKGCWWFLALSLLALSARADIATSFDESTMPTNLFLDVPNTSVGTIIPVIQGT